MATNGDRFLPGYLPYLLRRADQSLSAPFYAALTRRGIARSEWRVLAVLHEFGELGVVELAAAALSPQPTVTHALRRLEGRDLVTRTLGPTDRRQRVAAITTDGSALAAELVEEARQLETEALAEAGDLSVLIEQLTRLTSIVESGADRRAAESARAG